MAKVYILEGPDGGGKTTLAQQLIETGHIKLYHHEGPPPKVDGLLQYYAQLLDDACFLEERTVFDRLHLGELVYGPIMRGVSHIDHDGLKLLNRLIRARDVTVVVCLPPFNACEENWRRRYAKEYVKNHDDLTKIYRKYRALATEQSQLVQTVFYDYTSDHLGKILDSTTFHSVTQIKGAIGAINSPFLFVGEKANHDTLDLPFFSSSGSSRFLNDCLEEAGYFESEISMINAVPLVAGWRNLSWSISQLLPSQIIALGGVAAKELFIRGITAHHQIFHPAYVKRFLIGQRDEYVKQLTRIRKQFLQKHYRREFD